MLASLAVAIALAASPRILVMDVDVGQGVDVKDRAILTDAFASALHDDAFRLTTVRDVAALLAQEHQRQILGCSDSSCLAELGGSIGADGVARIAIGYAGETMILSGRIVESRSAAVAARGTAAVEKDGMLGALRRLGYEMRKDYRRSHGLPPPPDDAPAPPPPPEAPKECATAADCEPICSQGELNACHRLISMLEASLVPPRETINAAWDRTCELGELAGCAQAAKGHLALDEPAKALPLLRRVCDSTLADAPDACARAAEVLYAGTTGARDAPVAFRLASRACEAGRRDACDLLALALLRGDGVTRDVAHGAALLATSCDENRARGCSGLLEALAGWPDPSSAAVGALSRACERNVQGACEAVIAAHERAAVRERGLEQLQEACLGGGRLSTFACEPAVKLAATLHAGTPDRNAAVARRGCALGKAPLCLAAAEAEAALPNPEPERLVQHLELGCAQPSLEPECRRVATGTVFLPAVQRNPLRLEHLCALQVGPACHAASIAFGTGLGGAVDELRASSSARAAVQAYERVCSHLSHGRAPGGGPAPEAESCRLAASFYAQGNGVPRNPAWARSLQETACAGGLAQVCFTLGETYEKGRGVDSDRAKALRVYAMGCAAGNAAACSAEQRLR